MNMCLFRVFFLALAGLIISSPLRALEPSIPGRYLRPDFMPPTVDPGTLGDFPIPLTQVESGTVILEGTLTDSPAAYVEFSGSADGKTFFVEIPSEFFAAGSRLDPALLTATVQPQTCSDDLATQWNSGATAHVAEASISLKLIAFTPDTGAARLNFSYRFTREGLAAINSIAVYNPNASEFGLCLLRIDPRHITPQIAEDLRRHPGFRDGIFPRSPIDPDDVPISPVPTPDPTDGPVVPDPTDTPGTGPITGGSAPTGPATSIPTGGNPNPITGTNGAITAEGCSLGTIGVGQGMGFIPLGFTVLLASLWLRRTAK